MATLTLRVNARDGAVDVAEGTPRLWVLRDAIGLTGARYGCGRGALRDLHGAARRASCTGM